MQWMAMPLTDRVLGEFLFGLIFTYWINVELLIFITSIIT